MGEATLKYLQCCSFGKQSNTDPFLASYVKQLVNLTSNIHVIVIEIKNSATVNVNKCEVILNLWKNLQAAN